MGSLYLYLYLFILFLYCHVQPFNSHVLNYLLKINYNNCEYVRVLLDIMEVMVDWLIELRFYIPLDTEMT